MSTTLTKIFNANWKFKNTMPMDFWVEDAGNCYRIIIKNTCSWYCHGGGCTMCNYSDRTGISATDVIKNNKQKIIDKLINFHKNYKKIKFYINGSFFNEEELAFNIAVDFLNELKIKLSLIEICVESRPEFVNYSKLEKYIQQTGLKFEICFGIESTNDTVRNICLNKGVDIKKFYSLVNEINTLCNIKVYLLIKPPFLTEKQAIEDVINSVNELIIHGIYNISYTPIAIQNNTVLEFLLQEHLYRPVWIWSLIEINTRLAHIRKKYPQIHLSGLDYFPQPIITTFNCDKCSGGLLNLLKMKRNLVWDDVKEYMDCSCYPKWIKEMENESSLDVNTQLLSAINIFQKNLERTQQIKERCNSFEKNNYLTDVAKTIPAYNIGLDFVGIENLKIPFLINGYFASVATCNYAIELDEFHRGIHMSRLIEQLNNFANTTHEDLINDMAALIKSNTTGNSKLKLKCMLMKKSLTPVTQKETFISTSLNITLKQNEQQLHKNIKISIPFINACPCTLITSKELFNTSFTHTQKGIIQLSFFNVSSSLSDILTFAESYINIWDMLKREDEIHVVQNVFNTSAFCEDICREISNKVISKFFGKGDYIKIKVITKESIHPHKAFAKKKVLLY